MYIQNRNIPDRILKVLAELDKHPAVRDEVEVSKRCGETEIEIVIELDDEGYLLVGFFGHDLYMLKMPDGEWKQAYIGYDQNYAKEVLEQKYGLQKILFTHISGFGESLPVYI